MNTTAISEFAERKRQQRIVDTASAMVREGRSEQELVDYLEGENVSESAGLAGRIIREVAVAEDARKTARRKAYGTIVFGVAVAVVTFALMVSGVDATAGGSARRSPLGAFFLGLAMMANGANTLRKIDDGDF